MLTRNNVQGVGVVRRFDDFANKVSLLDLTDICIIVIQKDHNNHILSCKIEVLQKISGNSSGFLLAIRTRIVIRVDLEPCDFNVICP